MKKFMRIAFVAAFAAIAGYGVYTNLKTDVMSDLALANVEALARNEVDQIKCNQAMGGTCVLINNTPIPLVRSTINSDVFSERFLSR